MNLSQRVLTPRAAAILTGIVFVAALISHLLIARFFVVSLPFWDQWDSEGWILLRPFQSGTMQWNVLVSPHNEHRILFTRITALLLFVLNDRQWDNLVSVTFNAVLYALLPAMIARQLLLGSPWRVYAPLILLCVMVGCLPLAAENLTSGFQDQFYFLLAFALIGIWIGATKQPSLGWLVGLGLLAAAAVFTVAAGLFSGPCFAAAAFLRLRGNAKNRADASVLSPDQSRRIPPSVWVTLLAVISISTSAIAYLTMPVVPGHAHLHAQGIVDFCSAFITALSWPLPGRWWCAALLWAPWVTGTICVLRKRQTDPFSVCACVIGAWVMAQALAISHSRGHALVNVPTRYVDALALGLLANAFFSVRLLAGVRTGRKAATLLLAALLAVDFAALGWRAAAGLIELNTHKTLADIEIGHVQSFLRSGNAGELQDKPPLHIPYPDAARLTMMLSDDTIRAMLPANINPDRSLAPVGAPEFGILSRLSSWLLEGMIYVAVAFLLLLALVSSYFWYRSATMWR